MLIGTITPNAFPFIAMDCLNVTPSSRAAPGNPGIGLEHIGSVYEVEQSLTINVGRALDSTQFIAVP